VLVDRVEERRRLDPVPRAALAWVHHASGVDGGLHGGDDEPRAGPRGLAVAVLEDLGEVVARVDVHDRELQERGRERLDGQVE